MRVTPNPVKDDPPRFKWQYIWGLTCPCCLGHDIAIAWPDRTKSEHEERQYRCLQCAKLFATKLPQKLPQLTKDQRDEAKTKRSAVREGL